jgi:ATP-dependent RNA helicase DDX5/DBP2
VHRIGRTGRAGAKGTSISFFTEKHSRVAGELCDLLKEAKQEVPPQLEAMGRGGRGGGGGGGFYGGGRR